jgi:hypothetical protein
LGVNFEEKLHLELRQQTRLNTIALDNLIEVLQNAQAAAFSVPLEFI